MYICVNDIDFDSVLTICKLDFGIVLKVVFCFMSYPVISCLTKKTKQHQVQELVIIFIFWGFNTSFNNMSAISWWQVLFVEEAGVINLL